MNRKTLFFLFAFLFALTIFHPDLFAQNIAPNVLYVSGHGDDANDGKTARTAFRTLQKAAGVVKAGETVLIGNGNYTDGNRAGGSAVLSINTSGTKDHWITWKAAPGAKPEIH